MAEETTGTTSKFGWFKSLMSAVVGAALSFGVTFGVITTEQANTLNTKLTSINKQAVAVQTAIKNKDYTAANEALSTIVQDTTVVVSTGKLVAEQVKSTDIKTAVTDKLQAEAKKAETAEAQYK